MRKANLFWIAVIVGAALALYPVKYKVRDIRAEADRMEKQLLKEQESVHVLKAEWAHLTSPERLQTLTDRHLKLVPVSGSQLATSATIKAKLEPVVLPEDESPVQEVGYGR